MQLRALRERIVIESGARTADGHGGSAGTTWSTVATVSAQVRPKSGRERAHAAALEASADYEFTIRRRADLDTTMRIVWRGGIFNIRHVALPPAAEFYMVVDAERGVAT
jgi:SPP1 family predicted phage head-tail adaptor